MRLPTLLISLLISLLPLMFLTTLTSFLPFTSASSSILVCKCICFETNSTLLPLYLPKDPLHPCLTCTRQFCLDQKLPGCVGAELNEGDLDTGTGEGGDVEARCFERDSPKSHVLVILFISLTSILLIGALLKQYAEIDIQAIWDRQGIKGIVTELVQFARQAFNRRRGPQYSTVG